MWTKYLSSETEESLWFHHLFQHVTLDTSCTVILIHHSVLQVDVVYRQTYMVLLPVDDRYSVEFIHHLWSFKITCEHKTVVNQISGHLHANRAAHMCESDKNDVMIMFSEKNTENLHHKKVFSSSQGASDHQMRSSFQKKTLHPWLPSIALRKRRAIPRALS